MDAVERTAQCHGHVVEKRLGHLARELFPRWRSAERWGVVVGGSPTLPEADGCCDAQTRRLWVSPVIAATGGPALDALLVHEVCHAVAGPHHGRRFTGRMRQAADDAERVGYTELAGALRTEAEQYDAASRAPAQVVYGLVGDAAVELDDFDVAVSEVAASMGWSADSLRARFPRLRRVWDDARALHAPHARRDYQARR